MRSLSLTGKGTPRRSVAYEVSRQCGMWLSGFRSSKGHMFSIFPLVTLPGAFLSGVVEVGSCCAHTHTGLYLDFITTEQSCSQLTHTERGKWGKSSLKWALSQSVFKYWSLKGMTSVVVHQNHQDFFLNESWSDWFTSQSLTQLFYGWWRFVCALEQLRRLNLAADHVAHPASVHWLAGLDQA